jgi:hypothetical protein
MRLLSLLLRSSSKLACCPCLYADNIIMLRYNRARLFSIEHSWTTADSAHTVTFLQSGQLLSSRVLNSKLFYMFYILSAAGPAHPLIIRLSIVIFLCAALLCFLYRVKSNLTAIFEMSSSLMSQASLAHWLNCRVRRPKRTQQGVQQMKSNTPDKI